MTKSDDENKFNELMAAQDAKRAELDKDMAETKECFRKMGLTPYAFSELDEYLKLESWDWKDALLLKSLKPSSDGDLSKNLLDGRQQQDQEEFCFRRCFHGYKVLVYFSLFVCYYQAISPISNRPWVIFTVSPQVGL